MQPTVLPEKRAAEGRRKGCRAPPGRDDDERQATQL